MSEPRYSDEERARRAVLGLPTGRIPWPDEHTADRPVVIPEDHVFDEADRYKMGHRISKNVFSDRPLEDALAGLIDEKGQPDPEEGAED